MNIKTVALPFATALLLAACGTTTERPHHGHDHHHGHGQHQHAQSQRFNCQNGLSVQVRNLDTQRVELSLDDKRAVLSRASAASGERHTAEQGLFGSGADWHQKGSEAAFSFKDPYGNQVDTVCNQVS